MKALDFVNHLVVTEKSAMLGQGGKVVLMSPLNVTKPQIKSAFKILFKDLKIEKVSSMIVKGKTKRFRGRLGKKQDMKKFIITTEEKKPLELEKL